MREFGNKPMTLRLSTTLLALGVVLTGCDYSYNWTPGPQATGDLGIVSGQCKLEAAKTSVPSSTHLLSDQNGGYFVTSGPGLSGIIASSVQRQDIYNACMEANGFVVADAAQQGAGYSPSPALIDNRSASPEPHSEHLGDNAARHHYSVAAAKPPPAGSPDPANAFVLCVAQYRQDARMSCAQQRQAYKEYRLSQEDAVGQAVQADPSGTCQGMIAETVSLDSQNGKPKQQGEYTRLYSDCMSLALQRRQLNEDSAECYADTTEEAVRTRQVEPTQERLDRIYAQCMIAKGHSELFQKSAQRRLP
jgi:hypothetical protein